MTNKIWDVIVVGGSAAGLSAAQALGRSLRTTLILDSGSPRNRFADRMHNVLGHDGRSPDELVALGRAEAESYGVEFRTASVVAVREADGGVRDRGARLEVELESGDILGTRALVVASGATDVLPEIPGLAEHWGSGALHCPYCHGWEVRGRRIGVITTSPLGMHQARLVRQWSDDVTVFSAGLGDVDEAAAREFSARGVRIVPAPVVGIVSDDAGVAAVSTSDGVEHAVDVVFTASAIVPRDEFLAGLGLNRAEQPMGETLAVDPMQRTSHPWIWAVGNVVAPMATVPMAAGSGTFVGAAVNAALVEDDFARAAESLRPGSDA